MAEENKTVEKTKVEKVEVNLDEIFGGAPGSESITTPEEEAKPNIFSNKKDVDVSFIDKPAEIKEHGTRVTLYGKSFEDDTMQRPENVRGSKDFWQYFYLNQRFFKIPDGINFKVRCAYYTDLEKAQFNSKKNVKR